MKRRILFIIIALLLPLAPIQAVFFDPCEFDPDPIFCGPPPEPPTPDPIIIIPGITGSWNWDVLFRDDTSTGEEWKFPPIGNPYKNLVDALEDAGYEEGKTLFFGFYDWRQSNVLSAQQYLKPIIEKAKQESGKSKVDIIAHSMGGILARSYIQGGHYDDDIDQLFTLGTPHYGSSDVYTAWEGGYFPKNWDLIQRTLLKSYLFYKGIEKLALTLGEKARYDAIHTQISSVRDLLPTYDYLREQSTGDIKQTATLVEQNTTLNTFNANIDDLNLLVGSVTTIAGDDQSTVGEIPVNPQDPDEDPLWKDGKPDPLDPERNNQDGDNRVLLSSAHIGSILDQVTLAGVKHGDLPSKSGNEIFARLNLPDPGQLALVSEPESVLSFWFASPIAPMVTAPDGKKISLNLDEIPDGIYFGEDDPNGLKMIIIPNPLNGEYTIDLLGTADGHYDMASTYIETDKPESIETFSGKVMEGEEISYTAQLNQEQENPLDTNLVDDVPPAINIVTPENGKSYLNNGTIKIEYKIEDQSTINSQQSTLDGNPVNNGQVIDLSLQKLGNHTFVVSAADEHGNEGHATSTFSMFVTAESLKANIWHYFKLGLIKNHTIASAFVELIDRYQKVTNVKARQFLKKSFETMIATGKKTKTILPPAGDLLLEQLRSL